VTWPRLAQAGRSRVVAVDVARGVALIGMMAAHVLPYWTIAYGRAAALFAFIAGVGIALVAGGDRPERARPFSALSTALVVRAALLLVLGLLLGWMSPVALVILPYYAVLFILAIPFLRATVRTLALGAAVAALLVPVAVHVVLAHLPDGKKAFLDQPDFSWLAHPWLLLTVLAVSGVYPALPWLAYLLSGMAVGRLPLRDARTAWGLVGVGTLLAATSFAVSALLLGTFGGLGHVIDSANQPNTHVPYLQDVVANRNGLDVRDTFSLESLGTVPPTSWWWLALAGPHTTTPLDLLHTVGTSMLVLGTALLLLRIRLVSAVLTPLAAAGSMTLTLYSLHLVALKWGPLSAGYDANGESHGFGRNWWLAHVALALAVAWLWRSWQRRGPIEQVVHTLSVDVAAARLHGVNVPATQSVTSSPAATVD
jgi:uncharacterized membrane protein YeiB